MFTIDLKQQYNNNNNNRDNESRLYVIMLVIILSFLLPLFQEGQLSVTGESMCTKYWLTAKEV